MSTKKISQQTIETIFGQLTVNDWRSEDVDEYFPVLDEDERKRLMIDKAERQIIADSWKALQGLTNEEAAGIYLRILEQFEEGKDISKIYFER